MTLFEEVIKALNNENSYIRKNSILRFRELYRKQLVSYAKQKYEDEEAEKEIENSIKIMIYFISEYGYNPGESQIVKKLKKILSLSNYEKQLRIEMQRFISHQTTEYFAIEKKIRKIITPYFQLFTQKKYFRSSFKDAEVLGNDWISQQVFDIYVHKIFAKEEQFFRNKISKLESFYYEVFMVFIIRYCNDEIEKERVSNKIFELCRIRLAYIRQSNLDIFAESMEVFFGELKERNFILRTSLQNYWEGIYKTLSNKSFREDKKDNPKELIKLKTNLFTKDEVFAFIYEGLDAIEHVHAGKARILLLTGRKTRFTRLLQEASLNYMPNNFGVMPDYKNKQSEAQQRQDCKKALIEWMKAEVGNPQSNWFGEKGLALLRFICES